jgi:tetratricopeptide (TPR) repeat protein/mono/diheme cytochrome c family protein
MLKALCVPAAVAAASAVVFMGAARATATADRTPTFASDVAPIIYAECASCHRDGGDAPFSLTSYEQVRRRAAQIVQVTRSRYMPPWKPVAGFGEFLDARRLSDAQIEVIGRWVAAGAPQGDAAAMPPLPAQAPGWLHGEPDLVLELPDYTLAADGPDVFRNFVVTVPGREARYVRGLQFRPRSRGVHHANIRIDATLASRQLDEADPEPGYDGLVLHSADYPDGHFLGWTPGQAPPLAGGDMAWRLDGGSDFVVQLHMRPTGRLERVRPLIGLYFTNTPPAQRPLMIRLGRQNLDIEPGDAAYRVTDSFVLPVDVQVHAVQPHAHYRAKTVNAWATLPNGTRRPLIRIDDWDFNWQDQYRYREPFWLPAGTRIAMEYTFDNSPRNPRNPSQPPARVTWGWRSADEMADVWIQVLTRTSADRTPLQQQVDAKMLAEDAIGGELLLKRQPEHVALRNDTALVYMKLGKPSRALEHFRAVTRLEPTSAAAWYNEGVALEAMGSFAEAAKRYRRAVELNPAYSAAHNNLGSMLVRQGELAGAREQFELAIRSDPANGEAHANLALALVATAQPDAALAEVDKALDLQPDRLARLAPFVWLLVTHPDPAARRPTEGHALAERVVDATARRDPSALDALAASYAALGRYDEAVQTATEALGLLTGDGDERAAAVRDRIALYRRHKPFTLAPR